MWKFAANEHKSMQMLLHIHMDIRLYLWRWSQTILNNPSHPPNVQQDENAQWKHLVNIQINKHMVCVHTYETNNMYANIHLVIMCFWPQHQSKLLPYLLLSFLLPFKPQEQRCKNLCKCSYINKHTCSHKHKPICISLKAHKDWWEKTIIPIIMSLKNKAPIAVLVILQMTRIFKTPSW